MVTEVAPVGYAYARLTRAKTDIIIRESIKPNLSVKVRLPFGRKLEVNWDPADDNAWTFMNEAVSCTGCEYFINPEDGLVVVNRVNLFEEGFLYLPKSFMGICKHDLLQPRLLTAPFLGKKGCKKLARDQVLNAQLCAIAKV